jgi:hypothetical protein
MYTIVKIKVSREKQKNSGEKSILSFLFIIDKFAESKILLIKDDALPRLNLSFFVTGLLNPLGATV